MASISVSRCLHFFKKSQLLHPDDVLYTVKKIIDFPVHPPPSREVTNQSLPRRGIIKLFPSRETFFSDFPAGDGKIDNLFYIVCTYFQELILGNDNDGARPEEILVTKIIKHENYNGK